MEEGVGGIVVGNGVVVEGGNGEIIKCSVVWQTWTFQQSSGIARYYVVNLDKYLVHIDQLYHFMKIINLSRVRIPPPP